MHAPSKQWKTQPKITALFVQFWGTRYAFHATVPYVLAISTAVRTFVWRALAVGLLDVEVAAVVVVVLRRLPLLRAAEIVRGGTDARVRVGAESPGGATVHRVRLVG